jgi:hypothetical protein
MFQPLDRFEDLFHLVGFRMAFAVLDIDPGVALPGSFVHPMTGIPLAGIAKVVVANMADFRKADPIGVLPHPRENPIHPGHV